MSKYEMMSLILNSVLLIIGAIGLYQLSIGVKQLNLSKKDLFIRNRRESIILTTNLSEKFKQVLDDINDVYSNGSNQIELRKHTDIIAKHSYPLDRDLLCKDYLEKNIDLKKYYEILGKSKIRGEVTSIANQLEAISVSFVENTADIEVGYITFGKGFCNTVELCLPYILSSRCNGCGKCKGQERAFHYFYLIELYIIWKAKVFLDDTESEISSRTLKLNELKTKSAFQKSLGTD